MTGVVMCRLPLLMQLNLVGLLSLSAYNCSLIFLFQACVIFFSIFRMGFLGIECIFSLLAYSFSRKEMNYEIFKTDLSL